MAIRNIRMDDDPQLRKKCRNVDAIDDHIREILKDMAETMYKAEGAGLAANQVGVLRRLVVMDVGEGLIQLVNPEMTMQEGTRVVLEGCLSFPDVWGKVVRPEKVVVRALDENGQEITLTGEGLLAKCLCHELDHLDGIVFTDKVTEYVDIESTESETQE
ncbi:MAG: peptide deformylase [Eubacteriales bacterium]